MAVEQAPPALPAPEGRFEIVPFDGAHWEDNVGSVRGGGLRIGAGRSPRGGGAAAAFLSPLFPR